MELGAYEFSIRKIETGRNQYLGRITVQAQKMLYLAGLMTFIAAC